MTRLLRRTPTTAARRARAPRPGRHRHPRPPRRPARYAAAAGLLAIAGAHPNHPGHSHHRPARARAQVVRPAPVRAVQARWVTRTVAGPTYRGRATWYGPGFAGHRTASGEVFDPAHDLTAAHRWLPFGTRLRVCYRERCVVVRINDRGPFGHAILDLSYVAAVRLGLVRTGIAPVAATVLTTRPRAAGG